jgi:hypothetical protein
MTVPVLRGVVVWLACVALLIGGCAPSTDGDNTNGDDSSDKIPARSGCGSAAIACFDELASQAAGMVNFRPRSRWRRTSLTYRLDLPHEDLDIAGQTEAIARAVRAWDEVSMLRIQPAADGADADITISFVSGQHDDLYPFDGPGDVLGHAFFPGTARSGDVHLCAEENWALSPGDGQFDVFTAAIHEIGHAVGLEHSTEEGSVMSPGYPDGGVTGLAPSDIQAIRRLYGSQDGRQQPVKPTFPDQFVDPPDLLALDDPDTDGDGIPDSVEVLVLGTDPFVVDSDGDGNDDFQEVFVFGTPADINPVDAVDGDGDGLPDDLEINEGTDPDKADTDDDGLNDDIELFFIGTDPLDPDTDDDGLDDGFEILESLTDPFNSDSDFDGVIDGDDTDPSLPIDSDGDGLPDGVEILYFGTDPNNADTDGDGSDDGQEIVFGTNPLVPDDFTASGFVDSDGDGLPDNAEVNEFGTDPANPDTDGDGLLDGDEVFNFINPLSLDTDNDGLFDGDEVLQYGTDPTLPDSDFDGLFDRAEIMPFGTDPTNPDTDNDGLNDGSEVLIFNTNPFNPDTDNDHLNDGPEVFVAGTNPTNPDTDQDLLLDGDEVFIHGTNPLNPDTDADGVFDGVEIQNGTNPLVPNGPPQ